MSRVIKFRQRLKSTGEFHYWGFFDDGTGCHWIGPIENFGITEISQQFTGLHDDNDEEIYEGDIVQFTYWYFDGNHSDSILIGEVIYIPEMLSFALRGVKNKEWIHHIGGKDGDSDTAPFSMWNFDESDFSVIGNIHENPDLLQ